MTKVILYIAQSKDGFIASKDGSVAWLDKYNDLGSDFGYTDFSKTISTVVMGNKTYQQILGFDCEYPYKTQTNYVFTRNKSLTRDEHVIFIHGDIPKNIAEIKAESKKDIWLVGGASVFNALSKANCVDELIVTTMPVSLGEGIPLFVDEDEREKYTIDKVIDCGHDVVQEVFTKL